MSSLVIGTAGHVDHGKTELIKAITGKDTDRLQEEKDRGVSIDLGFASFPLPDDRIAGIVDVPGHERFIHNMLAGAGGIDLILLVIDVNEGIMPQTREHLNIMEFLGTRQGIVALTKVDLAEEEWCEIVEEEVRDELQGSVLEDAPLLRVSAYTGEGIEELKEKLQELSRGLVVKDSSAPLRVPVDRCFSIAGFGTVITGTLLQGKVSKGDQVEVLPSGIKARIRNVQIFGSNVETAEAGHRVALNLSGLEKQEINRGHVVCGPGYFKTTTLVDAYIKLLPKTPRKLKHMAPVHFYQGTSRIIARVAFLDREALQPGEEALVQIRLDLPLVAERQDRFIVRSYSPMTTIGGGIILDPFPEKRYRRYREAVLHRLEELKKATATGEDTGYLLQQLEKMQLADKSQLQKEARLSGEKVEALLNKLEQEDKILNLGEALISGKVYGNWKDKVKNYLNDYHVRYPLYPGVPKAQLKKIIPVEISVRQWDAFLASLRKEEVIEFKEDKISLFGFKPTPNEREQELLVKLEERFKEAKYQPPRPQQLAEELKIEPSYLENLLDYLFYKGRIIKVNDEIFFLYDHYLQALKELFNHFEENPQLTLAEFRDRLSTSRKFVQPLLEHFDQEKITKRVGDYRILLKKNNHEQI